MKKDDLIIMLIAFLLLGGILLTIFFGGEKSRHGVGSILDDTTGHSILLVHTMLDLGQRQVNPGKI